MQATCYNCGNSQEPWRKYNCVKCGGFLDLPSRSDLDTSDLSGSTLWRYGAWLNTENKGEKHLGEGNTPVIRLDEFSNVFVKLEYANPTGSFKDRGASVMVPELALHDISNVFVDSSGNAGAALAAYSSRWGIKCEVFVPEAAAVEKETQIMAYGAKFHRIKGERDDILKAMLPWLNDSSKYYASHHYSPYYLEGTKTVAFEIAEKWNWEPPRYVFVPAGAGSLFLGIARGFVELYQSKIIGQIPITVAVQSVVNPPIVKAVGGIVAREETYRTGLADAIMTRHPVRLPQMKEYAEKGLVAGVAVTEESILEAWKILARQGIYCEPTSAITLAGHLELRSRKMVDQDEEVVLTVTGIGLKHTAKIRCLIEKDI